LTESRFQKFDFFFFWFCFVFLIWQIRAVCGGCRIAVVSTFVFIKRNRFAETLKISGILLSDRHGLIHKAVGWVLREVGKRDMEAEEFF
ncbi:MAG: DNA alkylation repair protein, partial [archaeon]